MFSKGKTAFGSAVKAALDEARQRGDRRLGTEHLLLGLLADPDAAPARALGIGTADARAALQALDEAALRAIGIDVGETPLARPRKHRAIPGTALTSSARAVVNQAIRATTVRDRDTIGPTELLLALLAQSHPDPVSQLLDELAIDRPTVRARLSA
jgi:ATP-dependent Clp protease ATP-binding subunit ClpA